MRPWFPLLIGLLNGAGVALIGNAFDWPFSATLGAILLMTVHSANQLGGLER